MGVHYCRGGEGENTYMYCRSWVLSDFYEIDLYIKVKDPEVVYTVYGV